ncbi:hypothetical protein BU16DRAFT_553512 [Lophium mytilinum]|uniref:Uncharacterized protein n=1 Tax=Lophium mytilinum TaxID=390894 RepID=A0A6A6QB08_9PEZI|nr:hypothetical protein BU16DRAFT_553512 [Lophium mytilinum]
MDSKSYELAWNTGQASGTGPSYQPWRAFWPPNPDVEFTEEEKRAKPWLTWRRDPDDVNVKPWYEWVNEFTGEIDTPCTDGCDSCGGKGCGVCSTVAEGG